MEERGFIGRRVKTRIGIALVAVALIGLVFLGCGDSADNSADGAASESTRSTPTESTTASKPANNSSPINPTAPEPITVNELRKVAAKQKTPIYWAGEREGTTLAFSPLRPSTEGRTFVRYLTGGAKADDTRPDFLTVVTYLKPNPGELQRQQAESTGDPITTTPNGTKVYYEHSQPESIFIVFPGLKVEVEVFAPTDFNQALQLVNSGGIVPVS